MDEPRAHCSTSSSNDGCCNGGGGRENEVTNIIDKQFVDGEPQYLVEWKHCAEDTWEPKANLANCTEAVAEFEKKWSESKTMQSNTKRFSTIEKILESRVVNGISEYRVKWRGCTESQSTWEPKESLNTPELITAFEKGEGKKSVGKGRKGKARPTPPAKRKKNAITSTTPNGTAARGRRSETTKRNAGTRSASAGKKVNRPDPVSPAKKRAVPTTSGNKTIRAVPAVSPSSSSGSENEDDGHEPEKILNATADASGKLTYSVKYKGGNGIRRVPATEIHAKSPQVAIDYLLEFIC